MKLRFQSCYLDRPIVNGRVYDLFVPEKVTKATAVFFVHGGGWTAGSRTGKHFFCELLNNMGYICATTDYRLNVNAFEQLRDIREAYDDFISYLKANGRPLKIAVQGSSAGAHLGGMMALSKPGQVAGEPKANLANEWVIPECALLQSTPITFEPWDEIFPLVWTSMQKAVGASWKEHPEMYRAMSPCQYLSKDNPRILFMEAECEHMFPAFINREFMEKQQKLGIASMMKTYPMAEHGFMFSLERKCQKQAWADFISFIEGTLR